MSSPGDSSASADSRSNLYHVEDGTRTPPTYDDDEAYARAVAASFELERGPDAAAAAAAAADEQFASMLQAQEISLAASTTPHETEDNSPAFHVEDPVWGKFEREEPPGPHVVLCIATCPCCVPPFCSPERKKAYKTVAKTLSFVLGVIQLIALIAMICVRGFAPTSINYMLGPWPDTLNMFGAKNLPEVVENYQLWRLLTPALLHAGIVHFLTNIVMQLRVGLHLEVLWGFRVYGAIYVGAAFASSIASMVFLPTQLGVGASGALMGVMGAWLLDLLFQWNQGEREERAARMTQFVLCFVNIVIILGFSFIPYVDWAAHLFGLVGGALLCCVFRPPPTRTRMTRIIGVVGFVVGCAAGLGFVYSGVPTLNEQLLDVCASMNKAGRDITC